MTHLLIPETESIAQELGITLIEAQNLLLMIAATEAYMPPPRQGSMLDSIRKLKQDGEALEIETVYWMLVANWMVNVTNSLAYSGSLHAPRITEQLRQINETASRQWKSASTDK